MNHAQAIAHAIAQAAQRVCVDDQPVLSPCVSVCRMDDVSGVCEGCLRTIDEIMAWGALADDAKRAVWQRLEQRAAAVLAAEDVALAPQKPEP